MVAELMPLNRGLEPQRRPFKAAEKAKRSRDWFVLKIGRAHTPKEKFDSALDYFRGMAAKPQVPREHADNAHEHLTRVLMEAGDQLAKTIRRPR